MFSQLFPAAFTPEGGSLQTWDHCRSNLKKDASREEWCQAKTEQCHRAQSTASDHIKYCHDAEALFSKRIAQFSKHVEDGTYIDTWDWDKRPCSHKQENTQRYCQSLFHLCVLS